MSNHHDVESQDKHLSAIEKAQDKFFESNAGDGSTVYDQYLHGIPLIMCLFSCFATLFLIGLDQTIVITLLEEVGNKFNGYNKIGWLSSGYMLTMAVFAATWGKLSIIFGRKWAMLISLVLFEAGSLMCGLASSMNILIGGRILAGIGGGGIQTLVFVVGSELTPIDRRPLVFVLFGLAFATSSVSGPLIGGAFTLHSTWRWCFYINLPIGGLAGVFLSVFFHPPKAKGSIKEKLLLIDYPGTFLLTAGVVLFLLGLTFGGEEFPWNSGAVISLFVLGGLIIIAFCVWNFKFSKNPILPLSIVSVPQVVFPVLSITIAFYCFMGVAVYLSTYFQVIDGYGAWQTGVHLLPMIIPVVISSISSGILIRKTRYIKPYAVFGAVLGSVGFGCMTLLKVDSPPSHKIGLLILPGFYIGLTLQTSMISVQLHAPKLPGSMILSTTFLNFSRALGGAIGADLSQAIFNATVKTKLEKVLATTTDESLRGLDSSQITSLMSSPDAIKTLSSTGQSLVKGAIMGAIKNVFIVSASLCCVSFITTCLYSNKRLPKSEDIQKEAKKEEQEEEEQAQEKDQDQDQSISNDSNNVVYDEKPTPIGAIATSESK